MINALDLHDESLLHFGIKLIRAGHWKLVLGVEAADLGCAISCILLDNCCVLAQVGDPVLGTRRLIIGEGLAFLLASWSAVGRRLT